MKKNNSIILLIIISISVALTFQGIVFAKDRHLNYFVKYFIKNRIKKTEVNIKEKTKAPNPFKAIYLTVNTISSTYGNTLVDNLIKNKGNAVVIDVQHGDGLLAFRPKNSLLKRLNPGSDKIKNFPEIIKKLHEKNIYVVARQVVFNDYFLGSRNPNLRIKNKWGGYYKSEWLDPSKAMVQNYNIYLMMELADMGFDEIQFDYIRFPATTNSYLDYNYNEEKFTRADVINNFLKKASNVAEEYKINLSADVFGAIVWGNVDWKIVGQNTEEMAKYLDAIYPMTYPSHVNPGYYGHNNVWNNPYNFVHNSIKLFIEKANGKAEIRTWIQGFPLHSPGFSTNYIKTQIQASFDAGASGYSVWSPNNKYNVTWPALELNPKIETEEN